MDNETQKIIAQLQNISLSHEEREKMRAHLSSYADYHPVHLSGTHSGAPGRLEFLQSFFNTRTAQACFSLVLVFGLGAGTSFAAESALPGDILYSIKVNVNEPVATVLAGTPESKARLYSEFAKRRLEEATTLVAEKKLTPEARSVIEASLTEQVKLAGALADTLESSGNTEEALSVRSDLESNLVANSLAVQIAAGNDNPHDQQEAAALLNTVALATDHVTRARMHSESKMTFTTRSAATSTMKVAARKLREAKIDVDAAVANSSSSTVKKAEQTIHMGEAALQDAEVAQSTTSATAALILGEHAKRDANEVSTAARVAKQLGIPLGEVSDDTDSATSDHVNATSSSDVIGADATTTSRVRIHLNGLSGHEDDK